MAQGPVSFTWTATSIMEQSQPNPQLFSITLSFLNINILKINFAVRFIQSRNINKILK